MPEQSQPAPPSQALTQGYLHFTLGGEDFAVPLAVVDGVIDEVMQDLEFIPVPQAPNFVEGILNLRGKILPVVDLYRRFGIPARGERDFQILVVRSQGYEVGLKVDEVKGLLAQERMALEALPEVVSTAVNREFLLHVGKCRVQDKDKQEELFLFVINLERILSLSEKKRLQAKELQGEGVGGAIPELVREEEELYVRFTIEEESFAVPARSVGEVILLEDVRRIPFTPPSVVGVVNLRGEVLWVLDVREVLGLESEPKRFAKALVLKDGDVRAAICIEGEAKLLTLRAEEVLPPLSTLEGIKQEFILGEVKREVGQVEGAKAKEAEKKSDVFILLNTAKLLRPGALAAGALP